MKILLVHNFYGSSAPSGENQVFEAEKALLVSHGHVVTEFRRDSDSIRSLGVFGAVRGALTTAWNPFAARSLRHQVDREHPDVVHVHNTFPLISPSIFHAVGSRAARVLTLHNYRLFCPAAIPMRRGEVCTECLDRKSAWPSLRYGCYRSSRVATAPLAINVALHRALGTWSTEVDAFITLTDFQRSLMSQSGLPIEKVFVKPNFYPGMPPLIPWQSREPYIVFAGRLTAEKGVVSLLKAWQLWGADAPELRFVGDGELRPQLEAMAKGLPVKFLGQMESAAAQSQIAAARLLVLPSEWFEGFPMVLREAFAFGTPAAVSNIGPMPSIVKDGEAGVVFEPADPQSLLHIVREVWGRPQRLEHMSRGARMEFESKYTEKTNYETLIDIYEKAICLNKQNSVMDQE